MTAAVEAHHPADAVTGEEAEMELPVVTLVSDLVGIPGLRRFVLVRLDEDGLLLSLRSIEEADTRFVVVPAVAFFPDYAPEVDDEVAEHLGLRSAADALLLLIVTVQSSLRDSTANLRAPVIVNRHTLAAAQVVLTEEHELRAPLVRR